MDVGLRFLGWLVCVRDMYTDAGSLPQMMQVFPAIFPGADEWGWNAVAAAPVYDASIGAWTFMSMETGSSSTGASLQMLDEGQEKVASAMAMAASQMPSPMVAPADENTGRRRRRGRRNRHRHGKPAGVESPLSDQDEAEEEAPEAAEKSSNLSTGDLSAFPPLPHAGGDTSSSRKSHRIGAWGQRAESVPDSSNLSMIVEDMTTTLESGAAQAAPLEVASPAMEEKRLLLASQDACASGVVSCPLATPCTVKQLGESENLCTEFGMLLASHTADKDDAILDWVSQDVVQLALSQLGCRLVQKLLDVLGSAGRDRLVAKLAASTVALYESPYGNHVLTKAIEVMPSAALTPIIEQVESKGYWEVARHSFGCRVLERLIEHCKEDQMRGVIDQLVRRAEELCRHKFGNFVIQHLLEHGEDHRKAAVVERLLPYMSYLSMHRTASHVVQQALNYAGSEGQLAIVQALLHAQGDNALVEVAASRYGSYVVEELSHLRCMWVAEEVRRRLTEAPVHLRSSTSFKRVAATYGMALTCENDACSEAKP